MNAYNAIHNDQGNYAGIRDEFTSEAILAYAQGIEDRGTGCPWMTPGEEWGYCREQVKRELGL